MASYARSQIIAPESQVASYLLTNRIVRKSWLFGEDNTTKKNYNHRKAWVENRINTLIDNSFFMDLHTYVIMSNHFHVVVTTRPDLCNEATDEEIVQRWWNLFPKKVGDSYPASTPEKLKKKRLADSTWLKERRRKLCSISTFMGQVAVHVARRANKEDKCTGHFWQGRFDSQLLMDADAVMSANMYVDLNPIRAGMVDDIRKVKNGSIIKRLKILEDQGVDLKPIPYLSIANPAFESSRDNRCLIDHSLQRYIEILDCLSRTDPSLRKTDKFDSVSIYDVKSFRFAVGTRERVDEFAASRKRSRENIRKKLKVHD